MIYGLWLVNEKRWMRTGDDTADHGAVVAFVGEQDEALSRAMDAARAAIDAHPGIGHIHVCNLDAIDHESRYLFGIAIDGSMNPKEQELHRRLREDIASGEWDKAIAAYLNSDECREKCLAIRKSLGIQTIEKEPQQ